MLWCLVVVADRVDRVRERVRERAAVRLRDFPQHFVAVRPSAEHRRAEFTLRRARALLDGAPQGLDGGLARRPHRGLHLVPDGLRRAP